MTVRTLEQDILDAINANLTELLTAFGTPNVDYGPLGDIIAYDIADTLNGTIVNDLDNIQTNTEMARFALTNEVSDSILIHTLQEISTKISDLQDAVEADINNNHTQMYNLLLGVRSAVAATTAAIVRTACPCETGVPVLPISVPDDEVTAPTCARVAFYLDWFRVYLQQLTIDLSHHLPVNPTVIGTYEATYIAQAGTTAGQVGDIDSISVVEASRTVGDILDYQGEFGFDSLPEIYSLYNAEGAKQHFAYILSTSTTRGAARDAINTYLATKTDHHGLRAQILGDLFSDRWLVDLFGDITQDDSPYAEANCENPDDFPIIVPEGSPCVWVAAGFLQSSGNARDWSGFALPGDLTVTNNLDPGVWESDCPAFLQGTLGDYVFRAVDGGSGGGPLTNCNLITTGGDGHTFTLSTSYMNLLDIAADPIAVIFAGLDDEHASVEMNLPI